MNDKYKCKNSTIIAKLDELFKSDAPPKAAKKFINHLSPEDVIDVWLGVGFGGASVANNMSLKDLDRAKWMHRAMVNEVMRAFSYKQPETK